MSTRDNKFGCVYLLFSWIEEQLLGKLLGRRQLQMTRSLRERSPYFAGVGFGFLDCLSIQFLPFVDLENDNCVSKSEA